MISTRRAAFAYGRGRSTTAFTTLKTVALAPMASVRVVIAEAEKPGLRPKILTA
jgi:hypothetical protein